ncbi:MAG: quinolinate synthase NadA, partial [Actinobacteria bacterium]|nr:quinolinate synthase NadA [Actinomycetota bacterium]
MVPASVPAAPPVAPGVRDLPFVTLHLPAGPAPWARASRVAVQDPLPSAYVGLSDDELERRIWAARNKLGTRLVILGHHYQRDDIIKFADFRGDSFGLSREAASRPDAEFIVFCGVHFMAETAAILGAPHQRVVLPNLTAGCSMADMADIFEVRECWAALQAVGVERVVPVTYMNSAADLKAFCGQHGGIVCTSSNARAVYDWAFTQGDRLLFFPDQYLGRNTGYAKG